MKSREKFKKLLTLTDSDLSKEIYLMENSVLNLRIDIANRKTKGVHNIAQTKNDIARAKTIQSLRLKENDVR